MSKYQVEIEGKIYTVEIEEVVPDEYEVTIGNRTVTVRLLRTPQPSAETQTESHLQAEALESDIPTERGEQVTLEIRAPIPGTILSVDVQPGVRVEYGQPLLVLEAMKMKNIIRAPRAGVVLEVTVQPGQSVAHNDLLLRLGETK